MKLEVGKYYRSRGGGKWRVLAVDRPPGDEPVVAMSQGGLVLYMDSDGATANGQFLESEWLDPIELDWAAMPAWMEWAAMDSDGEWWLYVNEPLPRSGFWASETGLDCLISDSHSPKWTGDWRESKVRRPATVAPKESSRGIEAENLLRRYHEAWKVALAAVESERAAVTAIHNEAEAFLK